MSVKLIVSGYISLVSGSLSRSLCVDCYNGVGILTDWIPIWGVEDDPDCVCDMCGNLF